MHRHCPLRTHERWTSNVSDSEINYWTIFNLILDADAPIVTLSLGSNLDPKNLAKGTDVYLECRIEANPPIKKIEWYHNNRPLHSSRGIIITNQSLVLQSISKQTHGQYMCRAANTQGSVSSNDLYLDIKCESNVDCASIHFVIHSTFRSPNVPVRGQSY